jgi:hypothetical protein
MKKFKFLGIAVCVLLFVFAAGCQNEPQELIHRTELHSLPGPDGLEANVYDGMIILQWNNVPNASSYRVVRKDTSTRVNVALVTNLATNYYVDTVGWTNQLINDRDYEYSVISVSSSTTVVQNGESKITVKARIPDRSEFTPSLDADQINVTKYATIAGVDQIVVSFPNEPNYQYRVAYTYGADQEIVREFESFPTSNTTTVNWYEPVRTATFPTIGGTNSVSVKAWFNSTDQSYYSGNYQVTKTAEFAITPTLNSPANFQAVWVTSGDVRLTWTNVADATGYKIYRAPVSRYITSMVTTGNVTVSGDWTVIDAAQEQTNSGWVAFDSTTDNTGHYLYAIIAEGAGGAKSTPAYAGPNAYGDFGYTLNATVPDPDAPRNVRLIWTANLNTTYTLQYAEVQNTTDGTQNATYNNYRIVGSFADIEVPLGALPQVRPAEAVVTRDFTGEDGKNYIFRLTATRNGVSETFMSNLLISGAFSKTVMFTITATNTNNNWPEPGIVTLSINDNTTFRGQNYNIQVYRRTTTTGSETPYQSIGSKTYNSVDAANSWTFDDTTVTVGDSYRYKIVVDGFAFTTNYTGEATVTVNN